MAAAWQIAMDRQHLDSERRTASLAAPGKVAAQLRDHHDRTGIGLILIGMLGVEMRLARFPQLCSQVGFVHHYRPLSAEEQAFVLARHWPGLHLNDSADFTVGEAVAAITRLTGGNFPLTCHLSPRSSAFWTSTSSPSSLVKSLKPPASPRHPGHAMTAPGRRAVG
jgi:hypothetical protein